MRALARRCGPSHGDRRGCSRLEDFFAAGDRRRRGPGGRPAEGRRSAGGAAARLAVPELRARLGDNGRRRVQHYSSGVVRRPALDFFGELTGL